MPIMVKVKLCLNNTTPRRPMGNGGITPRVPNFFSGLMYWSWFRWKVEWFESYDDCKHSGTKRSWPIWDTACICREELRKITKWFNITCAQAEIRSLSLPHTSQKRYRLSHLAH
jgi:hypothetical protein